MQAHPLVFKQALGDRNVLAGTAPAASKLKAKEVEDIYKKMTQRQHILARPDTYVGSMEVHTEPMTVYTDEGGFQTREITYVPGLYKIFDEILGQSSGGFLQYLRLIPAAFFSPR